jgi:hypothetical protein
MCDHHCNISTPLTCSSENLAKTPWWTLFLDDRWQSCQELVSHELKNNRSQTRNKLFHSSGKTEWIPSKTKSQSMTWAQWPGVIQTTAIPEDRDSGLKKRSNWQWRWPTPKSSAIFLQKSYHMAKGRIIVPSDHICARETKEGEHKHPGRDWGYRPGTGCWETSRESLHWMASEILGSNSTERNQLTIEGTENFLGTGLGAVDESMHDINPCEGPSPSNKPGLRRSSSREDFLLLMLTEEAGHQSPIAGLRRDPSLTDLKRVSFLASRNLCAIRVHHEPQVNSFVLNVKQASYGSPGSMSCASSVASSRSRSPVRDQVLRKALTSKTPFLSPKPQDVSASLHATPVFNLPLSSYFRQMRAHHHHMCDFF